MIGVSRRGVPSGPPLGLEEGANTWKGNGQGSGGGEPQNSANNNFGGPANANNFGGPVSVFPSSNQGSPAGVAPNSYQGPPGSNTPQYTASPAPSGSSTPGPVPPPGAAGFPPPQNSSGGPPYNGPAGSGPFGSPSSNGPQFGRPGSSGPAFSGGPQYGPGGPNNFLGQPFLPSSSPFGHGPGGHPIGNSLGPGAHMISGPQPVDRLDPSLNAGRRHSYFGQPDYRIYELNKRLQQRTEVSRWGIKTVGQKFFFAQSYCKRIF